MTTRHVAYAVVVIVAIVAAIFSAAHLVTLGLAVGIGWLAFLLPGAIDGLALSASISAFVAKRCGVKVHATTWVALVLGLLVSVLANVAIPLLPFFTPLAIVLIGAVLSAIPPIALALSAEQLLRMPRTSDASATQPVEEETQPAIETAHVAREESQGATKRVQDLTHEDARALALEALALEPDLSAQELGARFGRSKRWGSTMRKLFREQVHV
ncbi:DUF2637 domain-containing protein [Amycolatopsis methanolica]|uniref:DUF2637 domain-containing protein n=1 Tax=Amycolatopsis methanolica TaxID=1814 RepID=UPI00343E34DB